MIRLMTTGLFLIILTVPVYAQNVEISQTSIPIFVNDSQPITDSFQSGSTEEQDWFVFYVQGGLPYQIEIPGNSVAETIDPQLEVFDEQGVGLLSVPFNFGFEGEGELLDLGSINDSGFYFIRVTNLLSTGGTYQLQVIVPTAPQGGGLTGKIVDQCTKNGIPKATIVNGTRFSMSHTTGEFGLSPVNPGQQTFSISKDGYLPAELTVDIIVTQFVNTTAELIPDAGCISPLPPGECSLDIDGNGRYDALTDGLLSIRYLFGIRGENLIENVVTSDCVNCSTAEIESILQQCGTAGASDIDGNGEIDALTDGLLIIRFLFEIRGEPLINGGIGDGCSRCTAPEIETYLQGLIL